MLHSLRKIVLVLMMAMVLLSPFMQLDSWDNFPTSTDDLELQIIFGLCIIGMFLVFAGILHLLPSFLSSAFLTSARVFQHAELPAKKPQTGLDAIFPPLRI